MVQHLTPYKDTAGASASLRQISEDAFYVVNEVVMKRLGHMPILKGDFHLLPFKVQRFIAEKAELMRPRGIYICDGSEHEAEEITHKLIERGMLTPLSAYENNYLCRTDPKDVARVESKTWMVTPDKYQTVAHTPEGVEPIMGHWMAPEVFADELDGRFPGCMAGRIMYVIPFSMGPLGGPLSKIGVQLTDANYVVLSMRIMTRVTPALWDLVADDPKQEFVRCIHSVGLPRPVKQKVINHWPCNPDRVMIAHRPKEREIWSYGSGYGGNSLLGKKCFALRIASNIAHDEGWMAEHMLIMGVTAPCGKEHFIAAAFPSACGKTNLAMLQPNLPGWKVRCVGDDIAWMKFGEDGRLYAINPEAGFFGVAPGTSNKTNPMAVATFQKNSIFTNVAETDTGEYYWEGLEEEYKGKNVKITDWFGNPWTPASGTPAAHANSRFCAPASQCPIIHPDWESPNGVPIDAIIFGGRRPEGVPLVFEAFSWEHGVFTGACLKSEATAAAEHTGKKLLWDPMAARPFMGYNFGQYLQHWLSMKQPGRKMPKIYHVNWFRKGADGKFLWPGYGDNIRVLDWVIKRVEGRADIGRETAIGVVPTADALNLDGLESKVNMEELMSLPPAYWHADAKAVRHFLEEQVGPDLPAAVRAELDKQEKRIEKL